MGTTYFELAVIKWNNHLGRTIVGWLVVLLGSALLIASLAVLLILTTQDAAANTWTPMKRVGEWNSPPPVVLCDASHIEKENLELILGWWVDLGYEFGPIVVNAKHRACSGNVGGTITIRRGKEPGKGHTRFLEVREKISWAKITLPSDPPNRMLAHEIGHALGWTHSDDSGHIMHFKYWESGWFSAGLRIGPMRSFPGARGPRRGAPGTWN